MGRERSNVFSVSESEANPEKSRRWGAYVCPECRFVLRIPKDHDGTGIVCPSCRRMLRIPGDGEAVAPLVTQLKKANFEAVREMESEKDSEPSESSSETHHEQDQPLEWDENSKALEASFHKEKGGLSSYLAVGSICLVSLALAILFMNPAGSDPSEYEDQSSLDTESKPSIDPKVGTEIEIPIILQDGELSFLKEAEGLARRFLIATEVEEIMPLINPSLNLEKKLKRFYTNGKIKPVGIAKFNTNGKPTYTGRFATVGVLIPGSLSRELTFVKPEKGKLRIDWESWVGWSEMSWGDLLINKPSEPVLVRVRIKEVDYYNFRFSDDDKWRCYSLIPPDREDFLYGYVKRNSPLDRKLRSKKSSAAVAKTLRIRFPETVMSGSQVIIEEHVADGWVVDP